MKYVKKFGGWKMRLITILVLSFLLSACSGVDTPVENESIEEQEQVENPQDQDEEVEELSVEEKMIQSLPEEANLEDWNLVLVNPWEALPEGFELDLVEVDNDQRIAQMVEPAWNRWKEAALDAGHRLFLVSGHRTIERQENNFNNQFQEYLNEGLTEEEARERTMEYLTEPGHSEHHTGLALDIVDEEWIVAGNGLTPEYDTQESQQWMVDTMADFGFILRYPESKEDVTGIQYESWHFRYVGEENAQFIIEHDLVLEEYIELLQLREEK